MMASYSSSMGFYFSVVVVVVVVVVVIITSFELVIREDFYHAPRNSNTLRTRF